MEILEIQDLVTPYVPFARRTRTPSFSNFRAEFVLFGVLDKFFPRAPTMIFSLFFVSVVLIFANAQEWEKELRLEDTIYSEKELYQHGLNLTSCTGAPSCGATMASYNGVSAKSNGVNQCTGSCCGGSISTGCAYQCVELAQRYFNEKFGITKIWYDNANMMCSSYPSGVKKTTNPQPGDLWVRTSGTYGHVAVITAVHSSTVDVLEQNSSPSGKNTYNKADAGCFLTAQGSSGGGSCSHLGYYCGNDGLGKDSNTLYYCSGSGASPVVSTACSFTCVTMPSGQDDVCSKSGSCSAVNTGYYCGSDKINGDSSTLYYCVNSKPNGAKKCANGCHTAASGYDDYCN
jgi:surface antigen